jgi:hypothetical protein
MDGAAGNVNVADHDVVFVNCRSLTDLLQETKEEPLETFDALRESLTVLREGLAKVLKSRGRVYCIIDPLELRFGTSRRRVSSHDWLPLPLELKKEPGNTLTFCDVDKPVLDQFRPYLDSVGAWSHVLSKSFNRDELASGTGPFVSQFGKTLKNRFVLPKVSLQMVSVATDRQENPLALICWYSVFAPTDVYMNGTVYDDVPVLDSGPLVLLVPPTQVSCEEGIRMLARGVLGLEMPSVVPSWVADFALPGETGLNRDIAGAQQRLEIAETELQELLRQREQKTSLKSILWENGHPLQEACRRAFEEIGINTRPSPVSDEFVVEFDGQHALVEVSGSRKSVSQRDVSQLQKDMASYFHEYGESIKGLFVGNSWKNSPPSDRGTDEKPFFPGNVRQWAANQKITLLSTTQLFGALCAHASGELDTKTIFCWLMAGEGEVNVTEIQRQAQAPD